jgi:hypothetical protein
LKQLTCKSTEIEMVLFPAVFRAPFPVFRHGRKPGWRLE